MCGTYGLDRRCGGLIECDEERRSQLLRSGGLGCGGCCHSTVGSVQVEWATQGVHQIQLQFSCPDYCHENKVYLF